jgi:hypothetical protein
MAYGVLPLPALAQQAAGGRFLSVLLLLPPQVLQQHYEEFCRCLRPPSMPLDVFV